MFSKGCGPQMDACGNETTNKVVNGNHVLLLHTLTYLPTYIVLYRDYRAPSGLIICAATSTSYAMDRAHLSEVDE
jgi:hypothetical protein